MVEKIEETRIVYGAWLTAIGSDKEAIVKLDDQRFAQALKKALSETDGNVDSALFLIRNQLIQELRRVL